MPCSGLGRRGALLGCPGGHEGGCRRGRKAGERDTCALPSPGEGGLLGCPWEVGVVNTGPGGPGWGSALGRGGVKEVGEEGGSGQAAAPQRTLPGAQEGRAGRGMRRRGAHTKAADGGLGTHRASGRRPCPRLGGPGGRGRAQGQDPRSGLGSALGPGSLSGPGSALQTRVTLGAVSPRYFLQPARCGAALPGAASAPRGCAPAPAQTLRARRAGHSAARPRPERRGGAWHAHLSSGARGHLRASPRGRAGPLRPSCSPSGGYCWPLRILGMPHAAAGREWSVIPPCKPGLAILVCPPGKAASSKTRSVQEDTLSCKPIRFKPVHDDVPRPIKGKTEKGWS